MVVSCQSKDGKKVEDGERLKDEDSGGKTGDETTQPWYSSRARRHIVQGRAGSG